MKHIAKGLAALGRGEDSMLVHMTPKEVAGLQKLALATGGSLTVNPHTGLPEAGWLSSILPMVAGGLATVFTGGMAAPLLAGAAAGALGAKAEGENPLMGGLMGALGGWGGAGLASGLGAAGATAGASGAAQTAAAQGVAASQNAAQATIPAALDASSKAALQNVAQTATMPTIGNQATLAAAKTAAPGALPQSVTQLADAARAAAPTEQATAQALGQMQSQAPSALEAMKRYKEFGGPTTFQNIGAGAREMVKPGGASVVDLAKSMTTGQKMGATSTALQTLGSIGNGGSGKVKQSDPYFYVTSASINPDGYTTYGPGYWTKSYPYESLGTSNPDSAEKKADGGAITAEGKPQSSPVMSDPVAATDRYLANLQQLVRQPPPQPPPGHPQETLSTEPTTTAAAPQGKKLSGKAAAMQKRYGTYEGKKKKGPTPEEQMANYRYSFDPATATFTKMAQGGGIAGLAKGRYIQGAGDGVSDDIPATIENKEPAFLADGEYVLPAHFMAMLGNGSNPAGARKMDAIVNNAYKMPVKRGQKNNVDKMVNKKMNA